MKILKILAFAIAFFFLITIPSAQSASASVTLHGVTTTNPLTLDITFLQGDETQATLSAGEAFPLTISFDKIAYGNSPNTWKIYKQKIPTDNFTVPPPGPAYVQLAIPDLAFSYTLNRKQETILFN